MYDKISKSGKDCIDVNEKIPLVKAIPLSIQHLFAMYVSSVLVTLIFKIDPTTVIFYNVKGTFQY